jgi:hypothetical protein
MNISLVDEKYIVLKKEKITLSMNLHEGILSIIINQAGKQHICVYCLILCDGYDYDHDYHTHLSNGTEMRQWIYDCAKNQHLLVEECITRRLDDKSPLILFSWNDDYVERLEIPRFIS